MAHSGGEVMADNDYAYLHQRAEAELEQAQRATNAKVAAVHHQLAEAYLSRASSLATTNAANCDALRSRRSLFLRPVNDRKRWTAICSCARSTTDAATTFSSSSACLDFRVGAWRARKPAMH